MPDQAPTPEATLFAFFNEVGILQQLGRAILEARLPPGFNQPQFSVLNHLVRVRDGKVSIRPIAGTRRRGATPAEDRALAAELLADFHQQVDVEAFHAAAHLAGGNGVKHGRGRHGAQHLSDDIGGKVSP